LKNSLEIISIAALLLSDFQRIVKFKNTCEKTLSFVFQNDDYQFSFIFGLWSLVFGLW